MRSDDGPGDLAPRPDVLAGPSLLPPVLVAAVGVAAMVAEVVRVVGLDPVDGQARPMAGLFLATALALGGFSATRVAQLLHLASRHAGSLASRHASHQAARRAARLNAPTVPWALTEAHGLHAIWVIGVGASIALMGLLGLWSWADGDPLGLEPGWPLLLVGALVALLARVASQRTSRLWAASGDGI